ncbi:MAG: DUF2065 domain-containing protein [Gammaproteobacteria bacterium]|nr:DUF2065 domain-containing protein [Gammaproteobacteria bacterium]MDH3371949.1 DUF2065 domain-containing protein [Gammaproteobacteria bacterium]MDH3408523.1 DUF2065 domain-containing protein [Gammaproteobacteria bacterium]MDH3551814.1 DUF2065 domain-containing protein [Gammaproteobacteria bacterium]
MFWTEILTAVALLLIIEGMLPFVGPDRYKQLVAQIAQLSDNHLRAFGLGAMLAGLLLLFLVRS